MEEGKTTAQLPRWKCHKEVNAAKIGGIDHAFSGGAKLHLLIGDGCEVAVDVSEAWVSKHAPEAGGYYVQYEDGYTSFSPERAFETGYTRI